MTQRSETLAIKRPAPGFNFFSNSSQLVADIDL